MTEELFLGEPDEFHGTTDHLSTTSILALFETDKAQRISFAQDIINRIENGEIEPLKVHLQLKMMENIIEILTDRNEKTNKSWELAKKYHKLLLEVAEKNPKKFDMFNASFETKETGVKYDYSLCGDPVITELLAKQKRIDEQVKERQAFLKTLPAKGMTVVIEETGEAVDFFPPAKSSTTSLTVSLK